MKLELKVVTSLFLVAFLSLSIPAIAADDHDMWDSDKVETVVRLKVIDNDPGGSYLTGEYSGLALMVETRKKGLDKYEYIERDAEKHQFPKNVLWYANVVFAPYTEEDLCDVDPTGLSGLYDSQISLKYAKHPRYAESTRSYGTAVDVPGQVQNSSHKTDRLKIYNPPEPHTYSNTDKVLLHCSWLTGSFFEWVLKEPLTVTDLINKINKLRVKNSAQNDIKKWHFPLYSRSGYTDQIWRGKVYNCVSFSIDLLRECDFLSGYDIYSDYKKPLPSEAKDVVPNQGSVWKRVGKGAIVVTCTAGGVALGALVGSYFFPGPGTAAGAVEGGEAGAAVATGVVAYISSFSTAATLSAGTVGVLGGGISLEGVRLASNAITADSVVKGLFHFDSLGIKQCRIIKTKFNETTRSPLLPRNMDRLVEGDIVAYEKSITYDLIGENVR